jgi:hypothetical protein
VPVTEPTPDIDFGRSVFVCSKPLQVLNCASIVRHFGISDARLHVLTSSIHDVDDFASFLPGTSSGRLFSSVSWNLDGDAAVDEFACTDYDSLFIEDDRVSRYQLFAPQRTLRMVLFEEGIGTYRTDAAMSLRGLRKLKWKVLAATTGCGWDFGEGRRTDVVMVSRPDAYRRLNPRTAHKAVGFPGLVDELERDAAAWRRLVLGEIGASTGGSGRVALVLAKWGPTPDSVFERAATDADVVLYKAHPHDGTPIRHHGVINVPGSWIPAEAFVTTLADVSDHLTVYHHSSSVAFYLDGVHAGVDYVDLLGSTQLNDVLEAARR